MVTSIKSWHNAKQHCIDMGARLMEIRTQEEFETALRFKEELGGLWLGGNDLQQHGNWVWDSNNEQVSLNEFWRIGNPTGVINRDCLSLAFDRMTNWSCSTGYASVCEYN